MAQEQLIQYQYKPLCESRGFRLVTLHSGSQHALLKCSVKNYALDSSPEFQALSYTWGSPYPDEDGDNDGEGKSRDLELPTRSCNLDCSEGYLLVTNNLLDALYQLRDNESDLQLWIDAICINQSDVRERASQVTLMGDIYHAAEAVIVWLGPEDEDAKCAVELHGRFAPTFKRLLHQDRAEEMIGYPFNVIEFYEKFGIRQTSLEEWKCYANFHRRAWFGRTWIIQEITLAKQILVVCGALRPKWEDMYVLGVFMRITYWGPFLSAFLRQPDYEPTPGSRQFAIAFFAEGFRINGPQSLWPRMYCEHVCAAKNVNARDAFLEYVLLDTRKTKASDPRDKVLGVLGLVTRLFGSNNAELQLHYEMSVEDVYTLTAAYLLQKMPLASYLSAVEDKKRCKLKDLPSWVPDLSVPYSTSINRLGYGRHWDCSSTIRGLGTSILSFDGRTLCLAAVEWDEVAELCEPTMDLIRNESIDDLVTVATKSGAKYANNQSQVEALWRTLAADCTETESPAPEEVGIDFRAWLCSRIAFALRGARLGQTGRAPIIEEYNCFKHSSMTDLLPSLSEVESYVMSIEKLSAGNDVLNDFTKTKAKAESFDNSIGLLSDRRLFRSVKGFLGLCPASSDVGDSVWVLPNAKVPFILRPRISTGHYELLGEAYLHGCMNGEIGQTYSCESAQQIRIQ